MAVETIATVAVAALTGGALTKLIERVFMRSEQQMDEATAIRHELREEVQGLRGEMATISHELVQWRDKYYRVLGEYAELRSDYGTMESKYTLLFGRYEILEERFNALRENEAGTQ